ncbi:MAG: SEC-C metal-binding domain-containing protein [Syntrophomonadaceae bacterium]
MARQKIGRNTPCPCGSGKKYKHCCGPLKEITSISVDPFIRYSDIMTALKLKLDQAHHQDIRRHRRSLQTRFVRFTVDKCLPREHETLFSDWLWFDVMSESGLSIGEAYLQENGAYMDAASRQCLKSLNQSRLGLYEAIGYADMHLILKDLATGIEVSTLLKEPLEFDDSEKILLLGRLVHLPEDNIFSGMVLMIADQSLEKAFLCEHLEYLLSLYPKDAADVLLKQQGEIIYGIFNHAQQKTLLKLNDIRTLQHHTTQPLALQRILSAHPEYRLLHRSQEWYWLATGAGSGPYARLAVGSQLIISCADLIDDINTQQQVLRQLWPDQEPIFMSSVLYPKPPAADMVPLWFLVIKDKETERWLDTPHPEEGITPRQMLAQDGGRAALEDILARFESTRENEEEKDLAAYMRERLNNFDCGARQHS